MSIKIFVKKGIKAINRKIDWIIIYGDYILHNDMYIYGKEIIMGSFALSVISKISEEGLRFYEEIQPSGMIFDENIKIFLETLIKKKPEDVILPYKALEKVNLFGTAMMPDSIYNKRLSMLSKDEEELMSVFESIKKEVKYVLEHIL